MKEVTRSNLEFEESFLAIGKHPYSHNFIIYSTFCY